MSDNLTFILAMSCLLPFVAGMIRYRDLKNNYRLFVFLMLLDVIMELVYKTKHTTGVDGSLIFNIYLVVNFALFLYFVYLNGFIVQKWLLLLGPAIALAIINFIFYEDICSPFLNDLTNLVLLRSCYLFSFTAVIMLFISIEILTRQITTLNSKLINNPWFWISSAYALSMSYNLLFFCLYIFAMSETAEGKSVGDMQHYVNAFSYVLFTIGVFKMPGRDGGTGIRIGKNKSQIYV